MRTIEHHSEFKKKCNKKNMLAGVRKCINMYHTRGLRVVQLNENNEFSCIEEIRPTILNTLVAGEQMRDIQRSVRTVKECTRYHVHSNPYKRYPRVMVKGCVFKSIKALNQLPPLDGI